MRAHTLTVRTFCRAAAAAEAVAPAKAAESLESSADAGSRLLRHDSIVRHWPAVERRRLEAAVGSLFDVTAWQSLRKYRALPCGATRQTLERVFTAAAEQMSGFPTSMREDEAALALAQARLQTTRGERSGNVTAAMIDIEVTALQRASLAVGYRLERKQCWLALLRLVAILAAAYGDEAAVERFRSLRSEGNF